MIDSLKNKKGFSLIELLIVLAIIGVLGVVAIPAYKKYKRNAQLDANIATLKSLNSAALSLDAREEVEIDENSISELSINIKAAEIAVKVSSDGYKWCIAFRRHRPSVTTSLAIGDDSDGCINQDGTILSPELSGNTPQNPKCTTTGKCAY